MGKRREITFPMFGDCILNQEGPAWKRSREMLRPPLQQKNHENLDVFRPFVDGLINILFSHPPCG